DVVPSLPPDPSNLVIATAVAFSGDRLWMGYAATGRGIHLLSLDSDDGAILSDSVMGDVVTSPVVTGEGVAAYGGVDLTANHATLVVRDPDTATVRWTADLTFSPIEDVAIAGGHVYAPDAGSLTAFAVAGCGASTCAPLWRVAVPGAGGATVRHLAVAPAR